MSVEWPLVSVVVPAYNAGRYIEDCLRSILDQDYPSLQVIVVDDGSTDDTAARVQAFGDRVTYRRQPNSGSAVARNLGVELAEGEFIAFNDSDDLWAPRRLQQQVAFLQGSAEYDAVCGRFMAVPDAFSRDDAARQEYQDEAVVDPAKTGWAYLRLLETSIYHIDTLLVRSATMKKIRFNPSYRRGQDFDFFLQLAQATPIAQLRNLYAFYRQSPTSITRKPHLRNYRVEILDSALERWGTCDQAGREITRAHLDRLFAVSWYGHGFELFRARWFKEAEQSFRRSIRHQPRQPSAWRYVLMCRLRRWQDKSPAHAPSH